VQSECPLCIANGLLANTFYGGIDTTPKNGEVWAWRMGSGMLSFPLVH